MARPWKMKPWPYLRKDGNKSWRIGYRDHDGKVRSRAFPKAQQATSWMDDYIGAERRGTESLRRFILDLDALEANAQHGGRRLGEVIQLYLAHNRPQDAGGLAPATFAGYRQWANRHLLGHAGFTPKGDPLPPWPHALKVASLPAVAFNEAAAPRAFRDELVRADVSAPTRKHVWVVLSSALSWAAGSALVPEIQTNGCLLANEHHGNQRRSLRRGGAGIASDTQRRRHGAAVQNWALSPLAVEHVRAELLRRTDGRVRILAKRDAILVSLQFGLGARNQEVYGLRWGNVGADTIDIVEVVSWGVIDEGKTSNSTPRRATMPSLLRDDLDAWKAALRAHGYPTRPEDFIIPGDLAGEGYGVRDARTDACHVSAQQAKRWGTTYFGPAVEGVAGSVPELAGILGATPYSLRRGGITVRLHAEDSQVVAAECGTSLQMLDRHYSFAMDEFRRRRMRPLDEVWREARDKVTGKGEGKGEEEPPQLKAAS